MEMINKGVLLLPKLTSDGIQLSGFVAHNQSAILLSSDFVRIYLSKCNP